MGGGEEGASTTAGVGGLRARPVAPDVDPTEGAGRAASGREAVRTARRKGNPRSERCLHKRDTAARAGRPSPPEAPAPGPHQGSGTSPLPGGPQPLVRRRGGGPPLSAGRTTAEGRRGAAAGRARAAACRQEGRARPHPPRPRQGGTGRALSTNPGPSPGQRGWARAAAAAGGSGGRRASVLKGSRPPVTWPVPARHFPPSAKKIIWNDRGREGAPLCFFSLFRKLEKQGPTARQVVSLAWARCRRSALLPFSRCGSREPCRVLVRAGGGLGGRYPGAHVGAAVGSLSSREHIAGLSGFLLPLK